MDKRNIRKPNSQSVCKLKGLKDIQTWIMDNLADFYVPSFKKKLPKSA
jgi:hypothetical protein